MANEGANRLARVLQQRMGDVSDTPPELDFGRIQGDMSLLTNQFPRPIPQRDYIICRCAAEAGITAGVRVLVIWVGDDACVVDVIVPADSI